MTQERTFHILTFGCQMNANDSDWLSRALINRGFRSGSLAESGIVILNTCSVRDKAEHKVYSELGRLALMVKGKERLMVAVGGCVAQQIGKKLMSRFPMVRLVFGTDTLSRVPDALTQTSENRYLRLCLTDFEDSIAERPSHLDSLSADEAPVSAFVNIMQGCDNFCSYCIVPLVRGRQKSRSADAVLQECRDLAASGCREITLLGQNVNSYGQDKTGDGTNFPNLLMRIAEIDGLERLRFMTAHPKDLSPELIQAFAETDKLCPRVHLPLQSGSDRILERMGRRYNISTYMNLVEKLRRANPLMQISTDIIVGFPGETKADFAQTMRVMNDIGFMTSYSFIYSDRPGARAVLFDSKVERRVALDHLQELQEWQKQYTEKVLSAMLHSNTQVLVDGKNAPTEDARNPEQSGWQGKDPFGNSVALTLEKEGPYKGLMVPVTITEARQHSLVAQQAGEPW